jgi:hypothetical protein
VAFSNGRERERGVMFDIIFPLQRRFIRFRPPLLHPCMRCDGRASIEESLLLVAYSETQEEEEDHKQKEEEEEAGWRRRESVERKRRSSVMEKGNPTLSI